MSALPQRKPHDDAPEGPAADDTKRAVGRVYDGLSATYDHQHVDAKSLSENRFVARRLAALIRPEDQVVDLGCGTGLLLDLLSIAPARYVGVDISEGMLVQARAKHPRHPFVQGDIERPPPALREGAFTVAVSLFGSSSYCDLERVRDSLWRLLAPGGRYFLMLCGPRYPTRGSYVTKHTSLLKPRAAADVQRIFPGAEVAGMSCAVDLLPARAPSWLVESVQRVETAVFGRTLRDAFYFLNVTGTR